jgi:hypothetical protein
MADRFWVGGNGNWDATTTTNWSTTSGGAGGASAPTSADDVYFDAGSDAGGAFTVTIGTGAVCRDITAGSLDFVMTLAGSAAWAISGSLTFPATNLTRTYTGAITFNATTTGKTITTNGVQPTTGAITFNGIGGEWTLGSALTTGGAITLTNGTLDVSASNFTITCTSWTKTGGTLNEQLGTFSLSAASSTFAGGTDTYYNVSFTSTTAGNHTITGANTFNDLTFTSLAATGIRNISVNANQTINGTLTFGTANTAIRRMFVRSEVVGTPITLTADTVATLADVDFRDIVGAGLGTWSGTRLGNCGGNTGITFDAGKDVYRVGTGGWSATQWSLTSGGSVDVNNFPLAQDTALFDTGTTTGTHTIDAAWNIGTLDMSALNVAVTLATGGQTPIIYGDVTLDADVTLTGTGTLQFTGASNQTVTSAGRTFTQPFNIIKPTTTSLILGDALTSNLGFTLTQGTLDLNDFDLTCLTFVSSNTNTRSIAFGTGEINVTGNAGTVWNFENLTNFTLTGEPNVNFTYSGSTGTRTILHGRNPNVGGELEAVSVNVTAGTDNVSTQASLVGSKFKNINLTGFSGNFGTGSNETRFVYGNFIIPATVTVASNIGNTLFAKSLGTQTLTTNGKTIDFPVAKTDAGTLQLLDNLTIGSTRTLAHTAGTIDLNDNTLTTGVYSATGSTARSIDFGTGTLAVGGNFTASGSNYTTAGTGSVSMTSASAKTFAGGGFTYPTLNQGGAGTLTITGANTFADISNTVQPATITFPANTTTSVQNLSVSGTFGNLITLNSSTAGTQWTIAKV